MKNIIRLGHVQRVSTSELVLEYGSVSLPNRALHINCVGSWRGLHLEPVPIFQKGSISLQGLEMASSMPGGISFSASAIGFLEGLYPEENGRKNELLMPAAVANTPLDAMKALHAQYETDFWRDGRLASFIWGAKPGCWGVVGAEETRRFFQALSSKIALLRSSLRSLVSKDVEGTRAARAGKRATTNATTMASTWESCSDTASASSEESLSLSDGITTTDFLHLEALTAQ